MFKWTKRLAIVLTSVSLAACGSSSVAATSSSSAEATSSSGSDGEKIKLTVYSINGQDTNGVTMFEQLEKYGWTWAEDNNVEFDLKYFASDYDTGLKAAINAGDYPDIFIIESDQDYQVYKDLMEPLDGAAWADQTDYAYEADGHVWGYPYAVEGYGLAYNKDILDKAGIDPSTLTTISGYRAAFDKLDSMKDELGLTGVESLAVTSDSYWVMGNHDLAAYVSGGLDYDDTSVVDAANKGEVDAQRMSDYADWVELQYSGVDKNMLTVGQTESIFTEFGLGHYAFMHMGTWADDYVSSVGGDFEQGFAPYACTGDTPSDGLFIGASSWYVVCNKSKHVDLAKDFLEHYCADDAAQKCQSEALNLISAFKNNPYKPTGKLASFLANYVANGGKAYNFNNQYKLPDGFNIGTLGPIYGQFALGQIDKQQFLDLMTKAFENIPNM